MRGLGLHRRLRAGAGRHLLERAVLTLAALAAPALLPAPARAAEAFPDGRTSTFARGAALSAGTTVGGYVAPLLDAQWSVLSTRVSPPNNMNVRYGTLHALHAVEGRYVADLSLSTNLNRSSEEFYITNDFCAGEHLVRHARIQPTTGEGANDNCLTIDASTLQVDGRSVPVVAILVHITQSSSRLYSLSLRLSQEAFGLVDPLPASASDPGFKANPKLREFLERLTTWARALQDAANVAIGFSKPGQAFAGLAPWTSLRGDYRAPPVPQVSSFASMVAAAPPQRGRLVLKDRYGKLNSLPLEQRPGPDGQHVFSTGDVIDAEGRVLQARIGEAVLKRTSGELWSLPLAKGSQGSAKVVRIDVDYVAEGSIDWRVEEGSADGARVIATVRYVYKAGSGNNFGTVHGPWRGEYARGQLLPHRFEADIIGPNLSDSRGHNDNHVSGEIVSP